MGSEFFLKWVGAKERGILLCRTLAAICLVQVAILAGGWGKTLHACRLWAGVGGNAVQGGGRGLALSRGFYFLAS